MANDIKQKIVLEGEKEYNRALTDAKRNLRTLKSELKAETAELGNNATAQQKNETRIKSLQKQIKEQEKVVKTYQDALKEVKEKYSDNEDAIAKWEVKLNEARATLANMKNDLDGVGNSFKGIENGAAMATVATKSVADSIGKIGVIDLTEIRGDKLFHGERALRGIVHICGKHNVKEAIPPLNAIFIHRLVFPKGELGSRIGKQIYNSKGIHCLLGIRKPRNGTTGNSTNHQQNG